MRLHAQYAQRNSTSNPYLFIVLEWRHSLSILCKLENYPKALISSYQSLLAGSPFWKETNFDCEAGGISQLQVNVLFLSLTASGIIQLLPNNKIKQWSIKQVYRCVNDGCIKANIGRPFHKIDNACHGINLFSEDCVHRHIPVISSEIESTDKS